MSLFSFSHCSTLATLSLNSLLSPSCRQLPHRSPFILFRITLQNPPPPVFPLLLVTFFPFLLSLECLGQSLWSAACVPRIAPQALVSNNSLTKLAYYLLDTLEHSLLFVHPFLLSHDAPHS